MVTRLAPVVRLWHQSSQLHCVRESTHTLTHLLTHLLTHTLTSLQVALPLTRPYPWLFFHRAHTCSHASITPRSMERGGLRQYMEGLCCVISGSRGCQKRASDDEQIIVCFIISSLAARSPLLGPSVVWGLTGSMLTHNRFTVILGGGGCFYSPHDFTFIPV